MARAHPDQVKRKPMYIHEVIHHAEFRHCQEKVEAKNFGKSRLFEEVGGIYNLSCTHQLVNFDRGHGLSIQEVSGSGNLEASSTVNHPIGNSK